MPMQEKSSRRPPVRRGAVRPRNESMMLYEMNADEALHLSGHIVIDSSLGLVPLNKDGTPSDAPSRH